MEKEEILQKAANKNPVGEMEKTKINKAGWISTIVVGVFAIAFMIVEGILGHYSAIYVVAFLCYCWASVFYTLQYFVAKRPWGVLVGAILEGLAAICMLVCYILYNVGVF